MELPGTTHTRKDMVPLNAYITAAAHMQSFGPVTNLLVLLFTSMQHTYMSPWNAAGYARSPPAAAWLCHTHPFRHLTCICMASSPALADCRKPAKANDAQPNHSHSRYGTCPWVDQHQCHPTLLPCKHNNHRHTDLRKLVLSRTARSSQLHPHVWGVSCACALYTLYTHKQSLLLHSSACCIVLLATDCPRRHAHRYNPRARTHTHTRAPPHHHTHNEMVWQSASGRAKALFLSALNQPHTKPDTLCSAAAQARS